MGRELVRVERVDPWQTANPSVKGYTVTGATIEETPRTVQFHTINDLKASLCAVAAQKDRLIWIGWRDSRFGVKDIVTAELDDSRFQHEDKAAS